MKTSKFLNLDWRDYLKGLLMAILTPVFTTIYASIESGILIFDWHLIAISAIGGAFAYLSKNFFTKEKEILPVQADLIGTRPDDR